MKYHNSHFRWLSQDEFHCLIGFSTGRVEYDPEAKWLYSFRIYCLFFKVEILWTT